MVQSNVFSPNAMRSQPEAHEPGGPADYLLDTDRRLVTVKFRNKLTVSDIARYAASLRTNPLFEPDFSEIVDMSEVEELDLKAEEFIRLADNIDPFSQQARRAFVARDSVQNHAARMHKILRTQKNIAIFSSVEAAQHWIETQLATP